MKLYTHFTSCHALDMLTASIIIPVFIITLEIIIRQFLQSAAPFSLLSSNIFPSVSFKHFPTTFVPYYVRKSFRYEKLFNRCTNITKPRVWFPTQLMTLTNALPLPP